MSRSAKGLLLGGALFFGAWLLVVVMLALTGEDTAAGSAEGSRQNSPSPAIAEPTSEVTYQEPYETTSAEPAISVPFGTPANIPSNRDEAAKESPPDADHNPTGRAPDAGPDGNPGRSTVDPSQSASDGPTYGHTDRVADAVPSQHASDNRAVVELSDIEHKRAEAAAFNFLRYAYSYSGGDREQYEAYINQAVVPESFRESAGAGVLEDFAENVGSGAGVQSTLAHHEIEISPSSTTTAAVHTTFVLEDPSGERAFSQDLQVKALGPIWKVAKAGLLRPAEDGEGSP